jgi:hypothetical protein
MTYVTTLVEQHPISMCTKIWLRAIWRLDLNQWDFLTPLKPQKIRQAANTRNWEKAELTARDLEDAAC